METLVVVAFLVACEPDLIHCRQLDSSTYQWKAHSRCEAELPRLKRQYNAAGFINVMGRCQIVMPGERSKRMARVG